MTASVLKQASILPTANHYQTLPPDPGVYKMLDKSGGVLYVGKAKNLKNRVASYFSGQKDIKTQILIQQVDQIDILVTASESQALILESRLIKAIKPKYNILLKDDKSYPYIKISDDPFPRLMIAREKKADGAKYYGPYSAIGSTRQMLRTLHDLFPIRDCKKAISLDQEESKCINLDIGRCIGPCLYKTVKADYDDLIQQLKWLLSGRNKTLLKTLRGQMKQASEERKYEKAASIRDRMQQIDALLANSKLFNKTGQNSQVWVILSDDTYWYVLAQSIIDGALVFQKGVYQKKTEVEKETFLENAFLSIFDSQSMIPDTLLCDATMGRRITALLKETHAHTLPVMIPKKGEKKAQVDLAKKNAVIALARLHKTQNKILANTEETLDKMQSVVEMAQRPSRIIGFDISHLQGQDIVASAVYFRDGKPDKSQYRRLKIKGVQDKSNDPLSMYEAVKRRLQLCQKEGEDLPDLLLIDGGRAQLNFAVRAVEELYLATPPTLISLAKREEEIYLSARQKPIKLDRRDPVLKLCQHIRDEAHRFAVTYQRQRREKSAKNSVLLQIEGLGPKRLNAIYKKYKRLEDVLLGPIEDLAAVAGIGLKRAEKIRAILKAEL